jgi:hypothetical protein
VLGTLRRHSLLGQECRACFRAAGVTLGQRRTGRRVTRHRHGNRHRGSVSEWRDTVWYSDDVAGNARRRRSAHLQCVEAL